MVICYRVVHFNFTQRKIQRLQNILRVVPTSSSTLLFAQLSSATHASLLFFHHVGHSPTQDLCACCSYSPNCFSQCLTHSSSSFLKCQWRLLWSLSRHQQHPFTPYALYFSPTLLSSLAILIFSIIIFTVRFMEWRTLLLCSPPYP